MTKPLIDPADKQFRKLILNHAGEYATWTRIREGDVQAALELANERLGGHGVEYVESTEDSFRRPMGLSYVNLGDTYSATVAFDWRTLRFRFGASWGDIVERAPRRFR